MPQVAGSGIAAAVGAWASVRVSIVGHTNAPVGWRTVTVSEVIAPVETKPTKLFVVGLT